MAGLSIYRRLGAGLIFLVTALPAQAQSGPMLVIQFEGMKSNQGRLVASLARSREQFLSREHTPAAAFSGEITRLEASWQIIGLAFGSYAISAYHDANDNGELDTGLFGIPTEDYGFSNNVRGSFGPPDFDDAAFEFSSSGQVLTIRIR